ncbi:hypothetical protein RJT34_20436 [Clitoria ternatea]|uniref:Uncharacterized protein n=1 Tax=Clitoria ternatea TaxID=43366 RepID=A0AAN9ITG7_CLITE
MNMFLQFLLIASIIILDFITAVIRREVKEFILLGKVKECACYSLQRTKVKATMASDTIESPSDTTSKPKRVTKSPN